MVHSERRGEFGWRMEDVLDRYAEAPDPTRPVVCFDELPYPLVAETRLPLPAVPGTPMRYDYEYRRMGTWNLFGCFEPHAGRRHVWGTGQRTSREFAEAMRRVVDDWYPEAQVVRVVLDNLNTHTGAALYQAFPPAEARRIPRKVEWRYTPKHGSGLNQMEIEWAVLTRQCLERRIGEREAPRAEVTAWEAARNAAKATVQWRFGVREARVKLAPLYPS